MFFFCIDTRPLRLTFLGCKFPKRFTGMMMSRFLRFGLLSQYYIKVKVKRFSPSNFFHIPIDDFSNTKLCVLYRNIKAQITKMTRAFCDDKKLCFFFGKLVNRELWCCWWMSNSLFVLPWWKIVLFVKKCLTSCLMRAHQFRNVS